MSTHSEPGPRNHADWDGGRTVVALGASGERAARRLVALLAVMTLTASVSVALAMAAAMRAPCEEAAVQREAPPELEVGAHDTLARSALPPAPGDDSARAAVAR